MRAFSLIAFACISILVAGDANAQVEGKSPQQDQERIDGENGKRGRKGRRGQRGARGKMQDGQGAQGRRRGGPQMMDMMFSRFDKDQNGSISIDEAPERMKQRFEKMDTNGDSSVSKEELQAAFSSRMGGERGAGKGQKGRGSKGEGSQGRKGGKGKGQMGRGKMDFSSILASADKNKDGVISIDEAPERMKRGFDRIDTDSSGTITEDEMKAAMSKMKQRGGARGRDKADEGKNKSPQKPKRPPFDNGGA